MSTFVNSLWNELLFYQTFFLHPAGSHDQSPRLMERYSGDSDNFDPETMMTQLRHDLADAMMDTQHSSRGRDAGECAFSFVSFDTHRKSGSG